MRTPEECKTMAELRVEIDALDRRLIDLLAQRVRYIDRAAELKLVEGLPANIPSRVEDVVAQVRQTAATAGFDAGLAEEMWRAMIAWSIAREEEKLGSGSPQA
ncbi:MAG: chorismate mutase [Pseudomonadota bacterium]